MKHFFVALLLSISLSCFSMEDFRFQNGKKVAKALERYIKENAVYFNNSPYLKKDYEKVFEDFLMSEITGEQADNYLAKIAKLPKLFVVEIGQRKIIFREEDSNECGIPQRATD